MDFLKYKYISDNEGNPSHIIIPLNDWDKFKEAYVIHNTPELDQEEERFSSLDEPGYLIEHYYDLNDLLGNYSKYSKDTWLKIYESYFRYYDALTQYDIQLLYFFRKKTLFMIDEEQPINKHFEMLFEKYGVSTYRNEMIDIEQFTLLLENAQYLNEISFLQYFNMNFKMKPIDFGNKRLKRKSERDRLFIYDAISFLELTHKLTLKSKHKLKYDSIVQLRKDEIIMQLANIFYNGNKSQVYRAKQEAQSKIDSL